MWLLLQATKAFMAGRKAMARELGARGREQSELMKAAHVEASRAIYKHRNPVPGVALTCLATASDPQILPSLGDRQVMCW